MDAYTEKLLEKRAIRRRKEAICKFFYQIFTSFLTIGALALLLWWMVSNLMKAEETRELYYFQDKSWDYINEQWRIVNASKWLQRYMRVLSGNLSLSSMQTYTNYASSMAYPNLSNVDDCELTFVQRITHPNMALQTIIYSFGINIREYTWGSEMTTAKTLMAMIFGAPIMSVVAASMVHVVRWVSNMILAHLIFLNYRKNLKKKQLKAKHGLFFQLERWHSWSYLMQETLVFVFTVSLAVLMAVFGGYVLMKENDWSLDHTVRYSFSLLIGTGGQELAPEYLTNKTIDYPRAIHVTNILLWFSTSLAFIFGGIMQLVDMTCTVLHRVGETDKDEIAYFRKLRQSKRELKYVK
ncbi:unnamed protein product, partial [Mesorhabditis spiculigera]